MSTIPFLIKFSREPGPQDPPENELGNKKPTDTQATVTPQPTPTTYTKVENETTDET